VSPFFSTIRLMSNVSDLCTFVRSRVISPCSRPYRSPFRLLAQRAAYPHSSPVSLPARHAAPPLPVAVHRSRCSPPLVRQHCWPLRRPPSRTTSPPHPLRNVERETESLDFASPWSVCDPCTATTSSFRHTRPAPTPPRME
jgi:hypothetical protein